MPRQLTHAPHGHILTNAGVWSPDGEWIVYDGRSDAAGASFDGKRIERVNVATGEVQVLYESRRGACCGVASCSPVDNRVAFILGPEDPTPDWQYCAYHRQGVIVDADRPGEITNLDARDLMPPFTPGALRGGSHVHQFSPDGQRVSFTYEDHLLASLRDAKASFGETRVRNPSPSKGGAQGGIPDDVDLNQRNIAVAFPRPVRVPRTHTRNHDGEFFSVVVTKTVNHPRAGSDEINRAYEEAWIALPKRAGTSSPPASTPSPTLASSTSLAFLGDLLVADNCPLTELFIVELPDDLAQPGDRPLAGTPTRRPAPPARTRQRRLTFTADRQHPGIQGPRHWPRSSADGAQIAFLMRDDASIVQLWSVTPSGGEPRQITRDPFDVSSAFSWHPAGAHIAYIADGSVMIVAAASGKSQRLAPRQTASAAPRPEACVVSPDGQRIAFVHAVPTPAGVYNQIFLAKSNI